MDISKKTAVFFSPTGSTKNITEILAGKIKGETKFIDMTCHDQKIRKTQLEKDELFLATVPVHSGRVPEPAVKKLQRFKGDDTPAVIAVVYGNRDYDDALIELKNTVEKNGFKVIGAAAFIAEHSIVHSIAEGRPDKKDIKAIRDYAVQVNKKVRAIKDINKEEDLKVKGNEEYCTPQGLPLKPAANHKCDKCGMCAKACPVAAIDPEDPEKPDKKKCISCMRCIKICSKGARELSRFKVSLAARMLGKKCAGYKAPEIFINL